MRNDTRAFDLSDFTNIADFDGGYSKINDELSIDIEEEDLYACDSLNANQRTSFNEIMIYLDDNQDSVFFIDGPGASTRCTYTRHY
jgi:hypothetical protein